MARWKQAQFLTVVFILTRSNKSHAPAFVNQLINFQRVPPTLFPWQPLSLRCLCENSPILMGTKMMSRAKLQTFWEPRRLDQRRAGLRYHSYHSDEA